MSSKQLQVVTVSKTAVSKVDVPVQFSEPIRPDLIKKAVLAIQSRKRQPYGASPEAGKRASAELSRRRHNYRGSYGFGISRVPRKILSRRGTRMNWVGAFAPGTVGGRRAHAPKAWKNMKHNLNDKERRKAIRSALAATLYADIVKQRGHEIPSDYPFVVEDKFQSLSRTKDVVKSLTDLGFGPELTRTEDRKIRPGRGTMRNRPYRGKKGPLVVVSEPCALEKAASNIPGVDVVRVDSINAELLAPGTHYGRLTIFAKSAIEKIGADNLYLGSKKGSKAASKDKSVKSAPAASKKAISKSAATEKKTEAKDEKITITTKKKSGAKQ